MNFEQFIAFDSRYLNNNIIVERTIFANFMKGTPILQREYICDSLKNEQIRVGRDLLILDLGRSY